MSFKRHASSFGGRRMIRFTGLSVLLNNTFILLVSTALDPTHTQSKDHKKEYYDE